MALQEVFFTKQFAIRKAEINDVAELSELYFEFVGTESNLMSVKKQLELISNNPNYFVAVACDGDKVIGTSMGIICYDLVGNCIPFMLIENLVLDKRTNVIMLFWYLRANVKYLIIFMNQLVIKLMRGDSKNV
jgi:hypothetical protein